MSQRKLESVREVYTFANCLTLDGAPFNPQDGKLYEVIIEVNGEERVYQAKGQRTHLVQGESNTTEYDLIIEETRRHEGLPAVITVSIQTVLHFAHKVWIVD